MEELVIESGRAERQYWRDIWRYRELFYFLAWRDLLVRYKQTVVGIAWSVIRPVATVLVFTIVFGRIGGFSGQGVPYSLMAFCGLLPWQFFSSAMSDSGGSLVGNSNLISKVYFPRLIVPASSVITSFVDSAISSVILVALMIWYRFAPSPNILFLPAFVLLALAASFGIGIWVAALMVRYRDFRIVVPFVVQFGLFISPVGFASSEFEKWRIFENINPRLLLSVNPMVGVIDGFRWCILGGQHTIFLPGLAVSTASVIVLLMSGIRYFRSTERTFADVI